VSIWAIDLTWLYWNTFTGNSFSRPNGLRSSKDLKHRWILMIWTRLKVSGHGTTFKNTFSTVFHHQLLSNPACFAPLEHLHRLLWNKARDRSRCIISLEYSHVPLTG
jgi:hypothetical protein